MRVWAHWLLAIVVSVGALAVINGMLLECMPPSAQTAVAAAAVHDTVRVHDTVYVSHDPNVQIIDREIFIVPQWCRGNWPYGLVALDDSTSVAKPCTNTPSDTARHP